MLATISLNGSELLLGGDSTADVASISVSGNQVSASLTGAQTMSFDVADVESIRFVGLGGDDRFTNNTSIPSFAFGQDGDDVLIGGSGNDRLIGGSGNDMLTGNDGDDEIRGGADGTKVIEGGAGDDRLFGGTGTNTIRGEDGNDTIYGGDSIDSVYGGNGDDLLYPGHGNNYVEGGAGDDRVTSGRDIDEVFGGNGDDLLFTGEGDDVVDGGAGDDWIGTNDGNDVIMGGTGADRLRGGDGDDRIEAGAGVSAGKFNVQSLRGGEGDDVIVGSDQVDFTYGDGGDDEITLLGGDDTAFGGAGDDTIKLGNGFDKAEGGDGEDRIEGGAGNDELNGGADDDRLIGGTGVDTAVYIFNQSRYRIAGSDLFVRDMVGTDGTDDVDQIEELAFASGIIAAESQIEEVVAVQPIIVSNSNGSNTAEYFGTAAQEAEIKTWINDIWYQARIQVNWRTPNTWNNTFANVGSGGTRPFNDAFEIFDRGDAAGVGNTNSLNIMMYFVEIVPGSANLNENTTNGVSVDGSNGVTFQVGDNLPGFDDGRMAIARVASHEIAHNLGLEHVSGNGTNLMNFPNITNDRITNAQAAQLISSRFSR
ncbi:calcium-binding protein [Mariniblastus fucicola]|uniref:calcium-binding protein n=1 Tax=Mariniblastus fucicola TaxID=980251 RepID=UPI00138FF535|nr:calcium-binding protein [Mariniblastus fucicola]